MPPGAGAAENLRCGGAEGMGAVAPAAWQEVEPEPSVSGRWCWANLGSALVEQTAEQPRQSQPAPPAISSGACLASRLYLLNFSFRCRISRHWYSTAARQVW